MAPALAFSVPVSRRSPATSSLTPGDSWTFQVSPYRGNVTLLDGEIPVLRNAIDVALDMRYEDELDG